jgi:nucleoside-diphosphate-sugar epimerase
MHDILSVDFNIHTLQSFYSDKRILITGGLGFIGSSTANRLAMLGAHIIILDSQDPRYGGNQFNLDPLYKKDMDIVIGDVRDKNLVAKLVKSTDIIFHFAAQVSYIDSGNMTFEDLEVNQAATLNLLEACRNLNPDVKILFSSSRLVIGASQTAPINEGHPTNPLSIYGVHKLAAEKYLFIYHRNYGIRATVMRITNPYGPRQQIKHSKYSLVGWFVRLAMEDKEIKIFGDGKQIRNYIYIDDVVEAFIRAGASHTTDGDIYFLASRENTEFRTMVELVVKIVGRGSIRYVPWPADYERAETGDSIIDISKITNALSWEPGVSLPEGITLTYDYYSKYRDLYLN